MPISPAQLETAGHIAMRGALVLFFLGFGLYKFTAVEAAAIQPLMANSPFFSWLYSLFSVQGASNVIGFYEVVAAGLILARSWSPRAALVGSVMIFVALIGTLSFLFTTPGNDSGLQGFIMKDIGLLAIALWSAGEAWAAMATAPRRMLAAA
jgi:reactive chlorine resistance protein C